MVVRDNLLVRRLPSPVFLRSESTPSAIGIITLDAKPTGKRSAGNPHAAIDVAGNGNLALGRGAIL